MELSVKINVSLLGVIVLISIVSIYLLFLPENSRVVEFNDTITFDFPMGEKAIFDFNVYEESTFTVGDDIKGKSHATPLTEIKENWEFPRALYVYFPGSVTIVEDDTVDVKAMGFIGLKKFDNPLRYEGEGKYLYDKDGDYGLAVFPEGQLDKSKIISKHFGDESEIFVSAVPADEILSKISPRSIRHIDSSLPATFVNEVHLPLAGLLITIAIAIGTFHTKITDAIQYFLKLSNKS